MPPYRTNDVDKAALIMYKYRNDILKRRLFFCTTDAISHEEATEATPKAAVEKKNLARPVSRGRGVIEDSRRINLHFDTRQYYSIVVPSIYDIARLIVRLAGNYPCSLMKVGKRDFDSAFRLIRLRRALSLVTVAEFPASHLQLDADLVSSDGADRHPQFARFGDAVTIAHVKCGLRPPTALMLHSFCSVLYVDDGIFVEANAPGILFATTQRWRHLAKGLMGLDSINKDKMGKEGEWKHIKYYRVLHSILIS